MKNFTVVVNVYRLNSKNKNTARLIRPKTSTIHQGCSPHNSRFKYSQIAIIKIKIVVIDEIIFIRFDTLNYGNFLDLVSNV